MNTVILSAIFACSVSAALAHAGSHMHPHGSGVWFAILGAATGIFAVALYARRGK